MHPDRPEVAVCCLACLRIPRGHRRGFENLGSFSNHLKKVHSLDAYRAAFDPHFNIAAPVSINTQPRVRILTENGVRITNASYAVIRVLDENPGEEFAPPEIIRRTGCSAATVYQVLSRLSRLNLVRKKYRGMYQSVKSFIQPALPDPALRIHALKLESRQNGVGWPYRLLYDRLTTYLSSPDLHRHPINGSITAVGEWRTRPMRWTLHKEAGLLEVFLEASTSPLHLVLDLPPYFSAVEAISGIPGELWTIRQADWNIDVPGSILADLSFRIEGASIAQFGSIMAKVYQKSEAMVRHEIRAFHPLGADEITGYIRSVYSTLESVVVNGGAPGGRP